MNRIMAVCVIAFFLMSTGSILTFSKEETLTEIFVFPEPEIKEMEESYRKEISEIKGKIKSKIQIAVENVWDEIKREIFRL